MSEDRAPYRKAPDLKKISLDGEKLEKVLEVYKNWIWGDGIEIAKLRTRQKKLEKELDDLKEAVARLSSRSEN